MTEDVRLVWLTPHVSVTVGSEKNVHPVSGISREEQWRTFPFLLKIEDKTLQTNWFLTRTSNGMFDYQIISQ